jgi:hypothetical protein
MTFDVEKSTKREPNKARMEIFNLSKNRRDSLSTADAIELYAGYVDNFSMIYSGDIKDIWTTIDVRGGGTRTVIESNDGGLAYRRTRVARTFGDNTTVEEVLRYIVGEMGIGEGNLQELESVSERTNGPTSFPNGIVLSGMAYRALDNIIRSRGLRWSVQNGNLQLRRGNRPVRETAVVLSPTSGLIDSPEKDHTKANNRRRGRKATISCKSLLIPGLYPGRVVQLESAELTGNYQVKRVLYRGSTDGDDWSCDLTLEEY